MKIIILICDSMENLRHTMTFIKLHYLQLLYLISYLNVSYQDYLPPNTYIQLFMLEKQFYRCMLIT